MSYGELVDVDPVEMKFPFELNKQISCSVQVTNKTENHVAFKVKTTNPKKYCVRPNTGLILPHSTCDIVVTMQAQKETPTDMQCKDKFLLQSVVASSSTTAKDVTSEMFNKEQTTVDECRLKVVYVSPRQPSSPVAEGSEEGLSPTMGEISSEARSLVSKLSEEKAAAVKQSNTLRQELELLKSKGNKSGVSIVFVIVVGILGVALGYFLK